MSVPLTVVIPNRDRMSVDLKSTEFHLESLKRQTTHNFKVLVIDGGSKNYDQLRNYVISKEIPNFSIMQRVIEGKFHKTLLNNVAIRSTDTPYVMTTDADIFFGSDFFEKLIKELDPSVFVESRTLYWRGDTANKVYNGEINPFIDIQSCRVGRIKKRTTPGGCQCGHIDIWNKVRGYDERYMGWGSEDVDLLARVSKAGYKVKWMGEEHNSILVFHQPHSKIDYAEDMKDQNRNLSFFNNIKTHIANEKGWGDK